MSIQSITLKHGNLITEVEVGTVVTTTVQEQWLIGNSFENAVNKRFDGVSIIHCGIVVYAVQEIKNTSNGLVFSLYMRDTYSQVEGVKHYMDVNEETLFGMMSEFRQHPHIPKIKRNMIANLLKQPECFELAPLDSDGSGYLDIQDDRVFQCLYCMGMRTHDQACFFPCGYIFCNDIDCMKYVSKNVNPQWAVRNQLLVGNNLLASFSLNDVKLIKALHCTHCNLKFR